MKDHLEYPMQEVGYPTSTVFMAAFFGFALGFMVCLEVMFVSPKDDDKFREISSTCPETRITNETKVWDKKDKVSFERATHVCNTHPGYEGNRCLKIFHKFMMGDSRAYRALCGPK